ncbi:MBL fold metallo-hydrolase [Streptomyces sp. NA02950]|uniref:MBL fold metallo-hydrolase n=1 Tax=Streptomyces sp. NA02950 TaxID=2742137 RepID=UPI001592AA7D|nr:MBL fold metallo-hydrolase [Streptomyces sp. NA02950]QKV90475.1 MBL fold metallo-hydrolase [Streptomyces sp. NA02950]
MTDTTTPVDERLRRPPGIRTLTLGDTKLTYVPDGQTVTDGEEVFPGVRVMLAPGHSAGHTAYVIEEGGQRVIAFGDAFHSPLQITHPLWENPFDHDHAQATSLRHRLVLDMANKPDTIGFGIHFADVPFGRVRIEDNQASWQPIDA